MDCLTANDLGECACTAARLFNLLLLLPTSAANVLRNAQMVRVRVNGVPRLLLGYCIFWSLHSLLSLPVRQYFVKNEWHMPPVVLFHNKRPPNRRSIGIVSDELAHKSEDSTKDPRVFRQDQIASAAPWVVQWLNLGTELNCMCCIYKYNIIMSGLLVALCYGMISNVPITLVNSHLLSKLE